MAGALIYAWVRWRRGPVRITPRELASAALIGTLLAAGGNGLVTVAEQHVPSGLAGLIMAAIPLWVVLWRSLARERVGVGTLLGVAVGFAGVAVLLLPGDRPEDAPVGWMLVILAASLAWSLGTFGSGRLPLPGDLLRSTGLQMASGGLVMILAGLAAGEAGDVHPSRFTTESLLAFLYLVGIGSIVAFTAYVWLLQHAPVSKVATYAFVNPVIAVFLGSVWLDEELTTTTILGAIVIVASVAFVVRTETGPGPDAPEEPGERAPEHAVAAHASGRPREPSASHPRA